MHSCYNVSLFHISNCLNVIYCLQAGGGHEEDHTHILPVPDLEWQIQVPDLEWQIQIRAVLIQQVNKYGKRDN